MIGNILFSDLYRPMALGLISSILVYFARDGKTKTRIILYGIYLVYVIAIFIGFFLFISLANESPDMEVLFWGIKWIFFFLIITIMQHFIYNAIGGGADIEVLVLNVFITLVLCGLGIHWIVI